MTIDVDRDVLMRGLAQSQHTSLILQREYTQGKTKFRETLTIDGTGLGTGRTRLTIAREEIAAPQLGPEEGGAK